MAADEAIGQAEFLAEHAHFVLEEFAQGLDELHVHALGQSADIVVRLDRDRWTAGEGDAFDDVGIERALAEKIRAAKLLGLFLEGLDEQAADDLALGFRVAHTFQLADELVDGIHMDEVQVVMLLEHGNHIGRLVLAHQTVVDEDAGQLVADGLVDQQRCDRRIDAAGQRADDALIADLSADLLDRLLAIGMHGPVALDAGDLLDEVLDQLGAVGRVHDLGVELHGVVFARFVGNEGEGRVGRGGQNLEARRDRGHAVAMGHPDLMARAGRPEAVEQFAILLDIEEGAAEFAVMAAFDLAAELGAHGLLAIADAEDRKTAVEQHLRRPRAAFIQRGSRASRQDDRLGLQPVEAFFGRLEGDDFAIDAGFADAACDQLRYLAAEIDDENTVGMCCLGHGEPLKKSRPSFNGRSPAKPGIFVRLLRTRRRRLPARSAGHRRQAPASCR